MACTYYSIYPFDFPSAKVISNLGFGEFSWLLNIHVISSIGFQKSPEKCNFRKYVYIKIMSLG